MDDPLLKDPEIELTEKVLRNEFGNWYAVYHEFINEIQSDKFSFGTEWRYYKDGKAWLCKIVYKKKTVVWLSAWKTHFKLGFYFTEKSGAGIPELGINKELKRNYEVSKPIGRLKPLIVEVAEQSQLSDVYTLLNFKIGRIP